MPRHKSYIPHGVIPAVLLPFHDDLSIDEKSFRRHLRDVTAANGLSAVTVNAHSTEVASCTFEEQHRVLDLTLDEIGDKFPVVNGIWADGSVEAARIARMASEGGASALLVFPPAPFTLGQSPEMALAHFERIADASDLPIIVFQYPLATGQGYPRDTLLKMCEQVPTIRAIKDWAGNVPQHEMHIRLLQNLPRPVNVLTTHSAWLFSSLVLGCNGLLSGSGSVIADLQAALFEAVRARSFARTAWKSSACRSAITLPLPESNPLPPSTSEENSHALCVVSTLTGRGRFCSRRMCISCCGTLPAQSLMARMVGTCSHIFSSVSRG